MVGTNTRKHKLMAFFWSLLNIPPEYSFSLASINLLALVKSKDAKKFGIGILIEDFIHSMRQLANGTTILVQGNEINVHGMLGVCFGDTPALAYLGGFKESVGGATR